MRAICKRTQPRKWQLTRLQAFLLVAVFTDVNCLGILNLLYFYDLYSAQNDGEQSATPVTWFQEYIFGDNMHYLDLFPIGVFGKSGTTKIWGGAFAPPAPPGYATADGKHLQLSCSITIRGHLCVT